MSRSKRYARGTAGAGPVPPAILQRARKAVIDLPRNSGMLSLDELACELGVHVRTLRAAARAGRLVVQFSSRSAFGRPIRFATRSAAAAFMERYYRQSYSRTARRPSPPDMRVPIGLGRSAIAGPTNVGAHARAVRGNDRRSKQGRRLSMGVQEADTVTGVLAEDRRVGEDICHRSTPCAYTISNDI